MGKNRTTFTVALFVFGLWTIYRLFFPENLVLDEILVKPVVWLMPVFIVNGVHNLGFISRKIFKNIFVGLMIGLLFSVERVIFKPSLVFTFSWFVLLTALATAITEEIFFRGYLLTRWLKNFSRPWMALLINGLFFTFTHVPIAIFRYHYQGYELFTYLLSNFVSGFINVYLYFMTGSIFTPIANHFIWNVFSGMFR